jgi:aminoglycoside phosphotransferase (APT) family kinase protein
MTDDDLRRWIETTAGGPVRRLERVGYGASRATFLVEVAGTTDLVARVDTGDGPMAGTELSLAREAEVYRALAGTGVRIPTLWGVAPDGRALLAERAAGTHVLDDLAEGDRLAVLDDYLDALAELHRVEVAALELPSYRRPVDGPGHALEELALWGDVLERRTSGPWPLARLALALLRWLAPASVPTTVLCHGDVGPGNFMHDGRRVTALLDWEFSHVGDPMDDLAWWVFRGHDMRGGCGDLDVQLRRWSAQTGLAVDARRIEYYRAVVVLRWLISVAAVLDTGGPGMDRSVHFGLVPVLAVRLPAALAVLLGVELPPPPPDPAPAPGPAADVLAALAGDLADVIGPAVAAPEAARRVTAAQVYVAHLRALDQLGPEVAEAEAKDLARLLGAGPASAAAGQLALATEVRAVTAALAAGGDPDERTVELLRYLWRAGHRAVVLWPTSARRAFGAPTPIPDLGGIAC